MGARLATVSLEFADRQHGLVSRRQLLESGVPDSSIDGRVRSLFLWPVFAGIYVVGRPELSEKGLWMASVLAAGEGAALGGRSAAKAWGFLEHRTTTDVVRVSGSKNRRSKLRIQGEHARRYLVVHETRDLPEYEVTTLGGVPVTTVARTLWDLAAFVPERRFARAFLEADRLGLLNDIDLARRARGTQGHRGGKLFSRLVNRRIPEVDRSRSVLEGMFLELRRNHGLPRPELNALVLGLEVDFVWRAKRVIVELDGYSFHRGREAFELDTSRNNQLRAAGWTVLRFTWRMISEEPLQVANQIEAVLGVAEKRPS